ncbi:hypothetical protein D1914_20675 [Salmonella enterica]|nr:hypothetical protein [Salmonella enterica subsp. enterica serovar Poona]EAO9157818.1 hypothetical protein [Salmonella enterica]EBJ3540138.1 hypothetical protein [Salmonella enterica]EBL1739184.1 hypothetical protein [Salmonella enterica]EBU7357262.1 hypothetical protein [Salmonella enterica subsp. enterica serovar Poona]
MRTLQFGLKLKVREQMNKMTTALAVLALVASGYSASAAAVGAYQGESSVNVEFYVGDTMTPIDCSSTGLHLTVDQASTDGNTVATLVCKNVNMSDAVLAPLMDANTASAVGGYWWAYHNGNSSNPVLLDLYKSDGTKFDITRTEPGNVGTPTTYETVAGGGTSKYTLRVAEGATHRASAGSYQVKIRIGTWAA